MQLVEVDKIAPGSKVYFYFAFESCKQGEVDLVGVFPPFSKKGDAPASA